MSPFRFKLARILDWYRKQCQVEENRLHLSLQSAAAARAAIETHRRDILARQLEIVSAQSIDACELAALGPFLLRAKKQEKELRRRSVLCEQTLDAQRVATLAAQRRLRLVEKLRQHHLAEYKYAEDKSLEESAAELYLAGFVRELNSSRV